MHCICKFMIIDYILFSLFIVHVVNICLFLCFFNKENRP